MPQGMTEIQQPPVPIFEFVLLYDRGFDHRIPPDETRQRCPVILIKAQLVLLQFFE